MRARLRMSKKSCNFAPDFENYAYYETNSVRTGAAERNDLSEL